MKITIKRDDLADGRVIGLLEEHHEQMQQYSPPESIHALNKAEFFDEMLTFWSAWHGDVLTACGALKQLSEDHGEIKAMKTSSQYLRRGIAEKILDEIVKAARRRNYSALRLETGSNQAFVPATRLYLKFGFQECGPFGNYKSDPYSRFFTLDLEST